MQPKYPKIHVRLTGRDGNAFAVLGRVREALRKAKVPDSDIKAFTEEATGADYNHLLATCLKWVDAT